MTHRSQRLVRRLAVAGAIVLSVTMSTGCRPSSEDSTLDSHDHYGTGSMEHEIARMKQMRAAMMKALDDEFGARHWIADPDVNRVGRSGGCDRAGFEHVNLRPYYFKGVYPESKWARSVEVVKGVARRYGFHGFHALADTRTNLDVNGWDAAGSTWSLAMLKATVLTVQTGCYKWAKDPGENAYLTIDPVPTSD